MNQMQPWTSTTTSLGLLYRFPSKRSVRTSTAPVRRSVRTTRRRPPGPCSAPSQLISRPEASNVLPLVRPLSARNTVEHAGRGQAIDAVAEDVAEEQVILAVEGRTFEQARPRGDGRGTLRGEEGRRCRRSREVHWGGSFGVDGPGASRRHHTRCRRVPPASRRPAVPAPPNGPRNKVCHARGLKFLAFCISCHSQGFGVEIARIRASMRSRNCKAAPY